MISWRRRVGPKMTALWRLKLVGITLLMTAFFSVYFLVMRHPLFPVAVVPALGIDRAIGFHAWALVPYATLWVFIPLPALMLESRRELFSYTCAAVALSLAGLAVFLCWPTRIEPPDLAWARYPGFTALKAIDQTGNACPSLHAAFAVFTAVELGRQLRRNGERGLFRWLAWLWCLAILYSTLATKQHVAVDVLAGAALGLAAAFCHGLTAGGGSGMQTA
jgi:membrane-associated phospholipid phosphatase